VPLLPSGDLKADFTPRERGAGRAGGGLQRSGGSPTCGRWVPGSTQGLQGSDARAEGGAGDSMVTGMDTSSPMGLCVKASGSGLSAPERPVGEEGGGGRLPRVMPRPRGGRDLASVIWGGQRSLARTLRIIRSKLVFPSVTPVAWEARDSHGHNLGAVQLLRKTRRAQRQDHRYGHQPDRGAWRTSPAGQLGTAQINMAGGAQRRKILHSFL